jgi:hypothetical protein
MERGSVNHRLKLSAFHWLARTAPSARRILLSDTFVAAFLGRAERWRLSTD